VDWVFVPSLRRYDPDQVLRVEGAYPPLSPVLFGLPVQLFLCSFRLKYTGRLDGRQAIENSRGVCRRK